MLINKFNIKVIILDLLKYEKKYIENIKKITKKKIISFHEYEDYSKFSDLIINYNFNNYKLYNSKTHLLGPKFTIFSEEIKNFSNSKNEDYIFLFFGGSDPSNLSSEILKNVIKIMPKKNFLLKVGKFSNFNSNTYGYKNLVIADENESIFSLIAKSKLCIVSGGNIMYECMFLKKQTYVIAHNDHQRSLLR